MSKRPQNGPSFSKAPAKRRKPMSDDEIAEFHYRMDAAKADQIQRAANARANLQNFRDHPIRWLKERE